MIASAGAERYRALLAAVWQGLAENGPAFLPDGSNQATELEWQSRWFAGDFGHRFTSLDGRAVEIVDFGCWNHGAGPDFTDCTVSIAGEKRRGCIEVDPDARDWEHHGHGSNPAYNEVVLHLFFHAPDGERFFTRTQDHREVAQVQLSESDAQETVPRRGLLAEARLGRCSIPLADMPATRVLSLLECAARYRLEQKAARLRRIAGIHGVAQTFFQEVAGGLGYSRNAAAFRILAQRLPLKFLRKSGEAAEALLFGAAGFLDKYPYEQASETARPYLRGLWEHWWRERAAFLSPDGKLPALPWSNVAARPGNHPQRRLGALAALLPRWGEFFHGLTQTPPSFSARHFLEQGETLRHPYWQNHYTLSSAPAAKPLALLGKDRLQDLLVNLVFPWVIAMDPSRWDSYAAVGPLLENTAVRRAALRLLGQRKDARDFQKKAWQQQGLLQLYKDFCLEDDSACADCPFPEQLRQWV